MFELQDTRSPKNCPFRMNSLSRADAEEALAEWIGKRRRRRRRGSSPPRWSPSASTRPNSNAPARKFPGPVFSDALNWLEALVSSMQLVGTIEESIGRVSDLRQSRQVLRLRRQGQKQSVDINESIHATLVILAHKLREKQIALKKDSLPACPPCSASAPASTRSGPTSSTMPLTQSPRAAISESAPGKKKSPAAGSNSKTRHFLCITIADDGPGIPLESQAHIFDPFYTTKPVGVGTGLGLGIVQRIVEQYAGTIAFSSEPATPNSASASPANATDRFSTTSPSHHPCLRLLLHLIAFRRNKQRAVRLSEVQLLILGSGSPTPWIVADCHHQSTQDLWTSMSR